MGFTQRGRVTRPTVRFLDSSVFNWFPLCDSRRTPARSALYPPLLSRASRPAVIAPRGDTRARRRDSELVLATGEDRGERGEVGIRRGPRSATRQIIAREVQDCARAHLDCLRSHNRSTRKWNIIAHGNGERVTRRRVYVGVQTLRGRLRTLNGLTCSGKLRDGNSISS